MRVANFAVNHMLATKNHSSSGSARGSYKGKVKTIFF